MLTSVILIVLMLLLSAFFSGMEIAFTSKNRLKLEIDRKQSRMFDRIADIFSRHPGQYITTILVGNNVVMVIYGIFMSDYLDPRLEGVGISLGLRMILVTLISTLIMLVTGEFFPKAVFRLRPNVFLRVFAIPVFLFYILFFP